jgi:hypothetical protein
VAPSFESQMRSAMRKAEREVASEMNRIRRKLEADMRRDQAAAERQAERDARRFVRRVEQAVASEVQAAGRRLGQQVDAENRKLQRRANSTLQYTPSEAEALDAAREAIARDVPRERDLFLCHAWADRRQAAKDCYEALTSLGLDVWFSEMDVRFGVSLPRQIDRGMVACSLGLVLVTPAFLTALEAGGWADKELGALLSTKRVIPVVHQVDFDDLSAQSPLLAQNAGFNTQDSTFREIAEKIIENLAAV